MTVNVWPRAPLSELTIKVGSGSTPRGGSEAYKANGIPLIRSMNVVFFGFKRDGLAYLDRVQADALRSVEVRKNDVLLNITGASIGRVTRAPSDMDGARVNQHVCIIRPNPSLDARYLAAYLSSPEIQSYIRAENYGVTRQALTKAQILDLSIPLPPIAEQIRIADSLDLLLARLESCRVRLDRVPIILKRLKQAVLGAAVTGELTRDWRGTGNGDWTFERAADVCARVQSGGTPKDGFVDSGVPFLKVYNIVSQRVDFNYRPQFISETVHASSMAKSIAYPGDVLMNIVGPPLGKVAVVPDSAPEWNINQAITLFRPSRRVTTEWLYYVLCAGQNVKEIIHDTRGSAGQTNISLTQCRDFVLPIPPIEEQREIARRVEALLTLVESLESRHANARDQVERLQPALLAKAFRAEPDDDQVTEDPAKKQLARVRPTSSGASAAVSRLPRALPV